MSGFVSLGGGIIGGGDNPNFATTLYIGNGSTQSIVTGKNNAAGSLSWIKNRSLVADHYLFDTVRGASQRLQSNTAFAQNANSEMSSFDANGFTLTSNPNVNSSGNNFVAWTFLEAAGFFDIVSDNGTGSARTQAHNLGAGITVGAMIRRRLDATGDYQVYHRMANGGVNPANYRLKLNTTNSQQLIPTIWNNTPPTDSVFSIGTETTVNASGGSYITYLFAHNPSKGIACGGFTTDGSGNATVNVGFRTQWTMLKNTGGTNSWLINDKERGNGDLFADTSSAESTGGSTVTYAGNGFTISSAGANQTYIYIAIR
jgi:hypothetical protein